MRESIRFVPAEDISTVLETALVLPNCCEIKPEMPKQALNTELQKPVLNA